LLPLDSSLETKQKLPFAADLAKSFDATIYLLKVFNTPLSVIRKRIDKYGQDAEACLKEKKVKFVTEELEVDNVAASIIKYSREHKIDLISIMTDQDTTTAKKFLGPYAQQLINNSEIPVLSLRSKEIN
jgi:nucleotide-binding universal stress UspA family protein